MDPFDASRTALATSLMRALHSRHDPAPLIADDWGDRLVPDAVRAAVCQRALARVPEALRARAAADPAALLGQLLRSNPAYADVITRTRYAEDALAAAAARGVEQVVLIGAGFDSFAWRRPAWATRLAVFEIDHPATQALKRQRLAACGVGSEGEGDGDGEAGVAPRVEFIAADLVSESLGAALARSSFDAARPAFFSWLGVTMYLSREANLSALRAIASCAPAGSELVFNYVDQRVFDADAPTTDAFQRLKADVAAAGEPFLSGFAPDGLEANLQAAGLQLLEDLNGEQALARYDPAGLNGLRAAAVTHIAHARVAGPAGAFGVA